MKKYLIVMILISGIMFGQQTKTSSLLIVADTTLSEAFTPSYAFGVEQTPFMFSTDTVSIADTLYIQVYDPIRGTYLRLENPDGTPILYKIEANKTYYLNGDYFKGLSGFKFEVTDADTADRTYTIYEK